MQSIASYLRLPKICLICQMYYQSNSPLCFYCEQYLQPLENGCLFCGASTLNQNRYCNECCKKGSLLHHLYAPYTYTEPLKTLINTFKFKHGLYLVPYLGDLILKFLPKECQKTDCLIPIPLHQNRLKERGFNQTLILAQYLGKKLKIPVLTQYCKKIIPTKPQSKLNQEERYFNLNHAFYCAKPPFEHITLIDDVSTTGTTLNIIAKNFLDLGVHTIDAWVIAKA